MCEAQQWCSRFWAVHPGMMNPLRTRWFLHSVVCVHSYVSANGAYMQMLEVVIATAKDPSMWLMVTTTMEMIFHPLHIKPLTQLISARMHAFTTLNAMPSPSTCAPQMEVWIRLCLSSVSITSMFNMLSAGGDIATASS